MAILWLLLGFFSVVGSSSTDPPTSVTNFKSSTAIPDQPTSAAAVSNKVTQSDNNATTIVSTLTNAALTNAGPSIIAISLATSIAPQSGTITTPPKGASTRAPSDVISGLVTSSESPPTATKQVSIPPTATNQYSASTTDNSITSLPGTSKHPEVTAATEPTQVTNVTKAVSTSTDSITVPAISLPSLSTEPSKDTKITTTALSSSASPPPKMTSSTIAGEIPVTMTTKSAIPQLPSGSSTVSSTPVELSTREDMGLQMTTETKRLQMPNENIEVKCTNLKDKISYVIIEMEGLGVCDNNGMRTEDGHAAEKMTKHVCKALNPEYQKNQYRCIIQLARINNKELAITEAFIESHLESKELYTQLKRSGADLSLFKYHGPVPDDEDVVSIPLISAIVSLAVLLLIIAAAYGCWHQRKARKREQRLTEELQTMENGYHDNPTLEVMETSPEMQEKKGGPNGELGDSWIVPLDNLTREDLEEEEDTHL